MRHSPNEGWDMASDDNNRWDVPPPPPGPPPGYLGNDHADDSTSLLVNGSTPPQDAMDHIIDALDEQHGPNLGVAALVQV